MARQKVSALAAALKADGWSFASHTYGHIDLTTDSLSTISYDTQRWKHLAVPLIGPTDMVIYPFGARPSAAGAALLRQAGFRIQFDIDVRPRRYRLVSVRQVIDPLRPWPLS